jgi:hypothetical protein
VSILVAGEIIAGQPLATFDLALQFGAAGLHLLVCELFAAGDFSLPSRTQPGFLLGRGNRQPCGAATGDFIPDALIEYPAAFFAAASADLFGTAERLTQFLGRVDRAFDGDRRCRRGRRSIWERCCGSGARRGFRGGRASDARPHGPG